MHPPKRIELLPVLVGSSRLTAARDPSDPFDDGRNLSSRAGADLKMGLGPSLTLDATINPDFGQVEADPSEVNLTAFATRFPERRPFFTEGAGLLTLNHTNAFYSRRIGRAPVGPASGDFVDYPLTSTILAAGKITGRLPGRTSLGILTAMTDAESARISDLGAPAIRSVRVAPRTLYGLSKVQREFGSAGSTASVLVGTVHRAFEGGDPLADLLSRNALVYGADAVLRFKRGEYELRSAIVGSYVQGQAAAIERIQRSSAHYMQRPDKGYSRIDPTRTSMSGFSPSLNFDRRSGSHWLFGIQAKLDGPTFEPNDLALLNAADGVETNGNVTYRETRPGRVFRNYSIRLNQSNEWNFGGDRQRGALQPSATVTWANFWNTALSFSRDFRTRNASLTRGGPLIGGPHGWSTTASFSNSSTSRTRWSGGFTASRNEMGGKGRSINGSFSFRPGPRWELSVAPSYVRSTDAQQYVATVSGGRPATFGNRYVFAHIERRTVSAQLRMAFTLRPDLTLDLYAEPFAASGRYDNFGELLEPASRDRLTYGTSGTAISLQADGSRIVTAGTSTFTLTNGDFTVRSFRSNVVLRWEWRPGSTVYVVWQQSRENREAVVTRIDAGDLVASFTEPGTNILLFKASFWIPFR
ncbi:MAG: hypothetical protein EXR93_07305 [Gemmatimonadetes bacterium]|nr:hypothetical protein [Gemmatimonadota bacterium]